MRRFQVIVENVEPVLSLMKMHSYDRGITNKRARDPLRMPDSLLDVHLPLRASAQKNGPSVKVAMVRTPTSISQIWVTDKRIDRFER